MTILKGDKELIQTFAQFRDRFKIDAEEIIRALRDDHGEWLLSEINDIREHDGNPTFDDLDELIEQIDEVHPDLRSEFIDQLTERNGGSKSTIIDVLKARDGEFIHLYDGRVHTIVRVFDDAYQ